MADNEIINALEKALEVEVVHGIEARGYYLSSEILKATIDIVNRQKAEIEDKSEKLRKVLPIVAELKAEAIKEFAEEYKDQIKDCTGMFTDEGFYIPLQAALDFVDFIKEKMTEGKK